jgi:hypothetical protein
VEANARDYLRSLALPSAGVCCGAAADEYDDDNTASPPALRADQAADTDAALQFGSTAFMYALLSMRCLLAEAEITAQRERSIAYFARLGLDGADGSRFMRTVEQLKAMLRACGAAASVCRKPNAVRYVKTRAANEYFGTARSRHFGRRCARCDSSCSRE